MNIAIILTFFVVLLSVALVFVFSRKKGTNRSANNAQPKAKNSQRTIPSVNKGQQPKKKGITPPGTVPKTPKEAKKVIIEKKLEEIVEEVKPAIELLPTEENEFKKHYLATKFDKLQPENSSGNIQYFVTKNLN